MWLQKASGIDCNVLKKITKRRVAILTKIKRRVAILTKIKRRIATPIKTKRGGTILIKSNKAEELPEVK